MHSVIKGTVLPCSPQKVVWGVFACQGVFAYQWLGLLTSST